MLSMLFIIIIWFYKLAHEFIAGLSIDRINDQAQVLGFNLMLQIFNDWRLVSVHKSDEYRGHLEQF